MPRLLAVWGVTAGAVAILYYFFLSQPYFRAVVVPFAIAILVAAVVGTWRVLRTRRHTERREHDRRAHERRAGE